jgi:hypothetical protein
VVTIGIAIGAVVGVLGRVLSLLVIGTRCRVVALGLRGGRACRGTSRSGTVLCISG